MEEKLGKDAGMGVARIPAYDIEDPVEFEEKKDLR